MRTIRGDDGYLPKTYWWTGTSRSWWLCDKTDRLLVQRSMGLCPSRMDPNSIGPCAETWSNDWWVPGKQSRSDECSPRSCRRTQCVFYPQNDKCRYSSVFACRRRWHPTSACSHTARPQWIRTQAAFWIWTAASRLADLRLYTSISFLQTHTHTRALYLKCQIDDPMFKSKYCPDQTGA